MQKLPICNNSLFAEGYEVDRELYCLTGFTKSEWSPIFLRLSNCTNVNCSVKCKNWNSNDDFIPKRNTR